jgi:hypothetical protein
MQELSVKDELERMREEVAVVVTFNTLKPS